MSVQTDTTPAKRVRKPRQPQGAPQRPTITDAEYAELLSIRLAAMHGFEKGSVDQATKNAARAAVRRARVTRKAEEDVLAAWNEWEERQAAEAEAAKASKPKRTRTSKAKQSEPTEDAPKPAEDERLGTLTEVDPPLLEVTPDGEGGLVVTPVTDEPEVDE